ncbi:acyltransferase [Haematobacter massiliensis]|uniref:Acyltransferase n=1 Tax=Haematobacter massiliensis TaxID=195105 RepID=A0A086YBR1_9RHOB|nr:acyltransferase family protein [Haematobacter massiliensis]KFI31711.1 acyltransferase [Haematobacter massiliensis]OWJ72097.1 acyltransferase [Haematobacter massiliensis]OWJ87668.1 acyltransferase [Haematobacter massiliensis]QBJ24105.1 acyltransferase [Haematobacter massiliensis]
MKYRPEIDGLRAIAVATVVLFHARAPLFGGGYIGVDIFFVISGFLITGILIQDIEARRYSLTKFYVRRARRILPALFVMLAACVPVAWAWMLPADFADFGRSIAAAALFLSNVHFWQRADYFSTSAELQPLLHTWSLAIEEQFYLFFPPLLFLLLTRGGRRVALIVLSLIALASLALAEAGWRLRPEENFFFTPSRIWELLAGSLAALGICLRPQAPRGVPAALGLAMILGSLVILPGLPSPSLATLLPVLGTVLVLVWGGQGTRVGRILSLRPVVWLGLISYSTYLWHQPLMAFARLRLAEEPHAGVMALLVIASVLLGWLSWRWVEQPFRGPSPLLAGHRLPLVTAVAGIVLFSAAGIGIRKADGFPERMPWAAELLAGRERYRGHCLTADNDPLPVHPVLNCAVGERRPQVAIMGDSHATSFAPPLQAMLAKMGIGSYLSGYAGCPPVPGLVRLDKLPSRSCDTHNRTYLSWLEQSGVKTLVLAARWPVYAKGLRARNGEGGDEPGPPIPMDVASPASAIPLDGRREARVISAYAAQVAALAERFNVVLVYPYPEAGWKVPLRVAREMIFDPQAKPAISTSMAFFHRRADAVITAFDAIDNPRIARVRPDRLLCDTFIPDRCTNAFGGRMFYFDDNHPSPEGAALIAPEIVAAIRSFDREQASR